MSHGLYRPPICGWIRTEMPETSDRVDKLKDHALYEIIKDLRKIKPTIGARGRGLSDGINTR
jgi:hypothetical protein